MQLLNVYGCRGDLENVVLNQSFSTVIFCDNQSTIQISTDPVQRIRTKHIEIHMHYIKELMHDGTIALLYCACSEQVADIFTKVLCEKKFNNIKSLLEIDDHVMKYD